MQYTYWQLAVHGKEQPHQMYTHVFISTTYVHNHLTVKNKFQELQITKDGVTVGTP